MKKKLLAGAIVCLQMAVFAAADNSIASAAEATEKVEAKKEESQKNVKDEKKSAKKKEADKKKAAPLTIEGDDLFFDDATGEVHATGNVVVTQSPDTLMTDDMRGNTKATEVWIDGIATMLQPEMRTKMTGHTVHYNYASKLGHMEDPKGMVGAERVNGKAIDFYPKKLVAHDASMTRCPAKVPDYHISAAKVEIWPEDKIIAYDAKIWIKNTIIYSVAKYQRSLRDTDKNELPRINYSNSDGVTLEQYFEYPLSDNWAAATNQMYSTKHGYRPQYALIDREDDYTFRIDAGDFRDSNSNWIKKEPEFRFDWHSKPLGKLPWSYTFSAIYGKWTDPDKSSWHQDYILYFTRNPIQLSDSLTWNIGTGIENVHESYDGSSTTTLRLNTALTKVVNSRLTVWTAYNYTKNDHNLFAYNKVDVGRELVNGFTYKIDRLNTIGFSKSYDLQNNRTYSDTWTWYRNLHCWNMTLSYEIKKVEHERKIRWDLAVVRW